MCKGPGAGTSLAGLRATQARRSGAGQAMGLIPSVSEARQERAVTQPAGRLSWRQGGLLSLTALGGLPGVPRPPLPRPPGPPCTCWLLLDIVVKGPARRTASREGGGGRGSIAHLPVPRVDMTWREVGQGQREPVFQPPTGM